MRLGDAALRALMSEGGWTVQLRKDGKVVEQRSVHPVAEDGGWRFDAMFGPFGHARSWTEEVLVSSSGAENIEPSPMSLAPGRAYAVTFTISSG